MTQQTAEMQVRLQQQELEKKFMQSSLETEILRHQLHQVQEQTRPVVEVTRPSYSSAPRDVAPKYKQVQPNSTKYPARNVAPSRTYQHVEEEEEEEQDDSDFQEQSPRPVRTRSVPASDPVPKSKKKAPAAAPGRRNAEDAAPLHPIIRNTIHAEERSKGVTFSREVVTIDTASPDVDQSSSSLLAVAVGPHPPPPPAKPAKDLSGKDGKAGNTGEHVR